MTPRRFLALHLPNLATDRLRRAEPSLAPPLAIWASEGPRRVLSAVDAAAAGHGLQPGQALADAQAILPTLTLRPSDPAADAQMLEGLALWARRYTPLTAPDPPDGLLLDITGCAHLCGDEAGLLEDALARLGRAGFFAQGAVAGAAATAGALARAAQGSPIIGDGEEARALRSLPLGPALRLEAATLRALARLGLRRVGDLLALPRGPLARRFGADLLDRLDAATGQRPAAIRPIQPPPALDIGQEFMEPIITRAGIDAVLDRLLEALCAKLRAAGLGARQLALLAWRVDGQVQEVTIGTSLPMRNPAALGRLFRDRLERLEPGLGFERMALEARVADPMAGEQAALGIAGRRDEGRAEALAELLDRLRQRLAVRRLAPRPSHWPEHSVARLAPGEAMPSMPPGWIAPPVLLLRRPQPIEVVAPLPDGPPALLRWRGRPVAVRRAEGPRRLEPEWWRGPELPAARDYHQIELVSGARLWVYRAGPTRWLLHGHLP